MSDRKCACSMSIKVLGDGCSVCNPEYTVEMLTEERDEIQTELNDSQEAYALLTKQVETLEKENEINDDELTIVYMSGFADGKAKEQKKVETLRGALEFISCVNIKPTRGMMFAKALEALEATK